MKRKKMAEMKRKILQAWERQNLALDVFETALSKSLEKIGSADAESAGKTSQHEAENAPVDGGFLTGLSHHTQCDDVEDSDAEDGLGPAASVAPYLSPTECGAEQDNFNKSPSRPSEHIALSY